MRLHRLIRTIAALLLVGMATAAHAAAYRNFRAAIYVTVGSTKKLADPAIPPDEKTFFKFGLGYLHWWQGDKDDALTILTEATA